jgi:hypothetical protein
MHDVYVTLQSRILNSVVYDLKIEGDIMPEEKKKVEHVASKAGEAVGKGIKKSAKAVNDLGKGIKKGIKKEE